MAQEIRSKLETFFSDSSKLYSFKKDHVLLSPVDEDVNIIFYLKSGYVKQTYCNDEGNEMILNIYKAGSYFPMMLYMSNLKNKYDFSALTSIEIYKADAEEVFNLIRNDKKLLMDLSTRYAKGISGLLLKIETLMFTNAYHKVILLLLYLTKDFGKPVNSGIIINIYLTHEDLASWLGIQRETVSKQFEVLEQQGIVEYLDKLIYIKDLFKLQKLVK